MKITKIVLLVIAIFFIPRAYSQNNDNIKATYNFSGNISVTNNGISIIPSFSIGKPAIISLFSIGGKRYSFDPDIRFSLDGKPWAFIFNNRYKLIKNKKINLFVGANLALNYKTITFIKDNIEKEGIISSRYISSELSTKYSITNNRSFGIYYLYSKGIDDGTIKNTHFITLNGSFSKILISKNYFINFNPQFYYLFQDEKEGLFFNFNLMLSKNSLPFSVSYIQNFKIGSNILHISDFIWSLNLTYSFNTNYTKK
jgi:hypothetical protein